MERLLQPLYVGLLLMALLPYAIGAWMLDPFVLAILLFVPLVWIGLPILFFGSIAALLQVLRGRTPKWPLRIVAGAAFFGMLGFGAVYLNGKVYDHRVTAAKRYANEVAPLLEAYRNLHGRYPETLGDLPSFPPLPWLLDKASYRAEGEAWVLFFPNPDGWIDIWQYDSRTGVWVLS